MDSITFASNSTVRSLGVIVAQELSFDSHIQQILSSAFLHLCKIAKMRNFHSQNMQKNESTQLLPVGWINVMFYYQAALTITPIVNGAAYVLTRIRKIGQRVMKTQQTQHFGLCYHFPWVEVEDVRFSICKQIAYLSHLHLVGETYQDAAERPRILHRHACLGLVAIKGYSKMCSLS